jgi:gas vesicle protein
MDRSRFMEAMTMSEHKRNSDISSGWYLLGGLAIGAVAGLLLAPKRGRDTRDDIAEWGRNNRERTRSVMNQLGKLLPSRSKTAAAAGALRDGAQEAFDETRDKAKSFLGA